AAALSYLDVGHQRGARPLARGGDDGIHGFRRPLHHRLDAAVATVAHPARHAELARLVLHIEPKPDPLDAPGDPQMPHDCHVANHTTTGTPLGVSTTISHIGA